jgi:transglutaminase-like putative cysteine protease
MRFRISHTTRYEYTAPASESFAELRVWPRDTAAQRVLRRELRIEPATRVDHYIDYFGNFVEYFSIPFRHNAVDVTAMAEVETTPVAIPDPVLGITLAEARQLYRGNMNWLFDFLQPTELTPVGDLARLRRRFFRESDVVREALPRLNRWIHETFAYVPGATRVTTPLRDVLRERRGVCQDFAHLMLAILRRSGFPARYVSGYIEAVDPTQKSPGLVGAAASHAWVEVYLPGGYWWGLDPTNNQTVGERHVAVAAGRDYADVAPMRGTYKGAIDQRLKVMVSVERGAGEPAAEEAALPLNFSV